MLCMFFRDIFVVFTNLLVLEGFSSNFKDTVKNQLYIYQIEKIVISSERRMYRADAPSSS